MSSSVVTIKLTYNLTDDSFEVVSDVKEDKIEEVLLECIRAQRGEGKDSREPVNSNTYEIIVKLDLEGDIFKVSHNCGNDSLSTGIIAHYCSKISGGKDK